MDYKNLKNIGDFTSFAENYPNVKTVIADKRVLAYMRGAQVIAAAGSIIVDEITKREIIIELLAYSDGEYIWDSRHIYYYEIYGMPLNNDFVRKCLLNSREE